MNNKKFAAILAAALAAVMVISLLMGLLAGSVSAASSSEIQNQIDQLEQEKANLKEQMAALEQNIAHNKKDIQSMIAQKSGLDQQIALLHNQIALANQTITAYSLMIADKQDELDAAEKKLALLHEAYKQRIRAMEEQGEISYWSVIFEANSFFEMLDHLNMAAEIAKADRQRLDEIRKVAQQVEDARAQLQINKRAAEAERRTLEASQDVLLLKQAQADAVLMDLLAQGDEYFQEMSESEKREHDLMDKIANLEGDKIMQEYLEYLEWLATSIPPTTTTTAPPTTIPPTTLPPTTIPPTTVRPTIPQPTEPQPTEPKPTEPKPTVPQPTVPTKPSVPYINGIPGKLVDGYYWYVPLPLDSYWVSSEFGYRTHPVTGQINSYHKGVDMAAYEGTPIYAVRDGVVRVAAYAWDTGNYVSLGHTGGYISIYMHMTHYIVKPGDIVSAGQIIGYVGTTGQSTGNHLHFGIAKNGTYMNPRLFLDL